MTCDLKWICAEIEYSPHAFHHLQKMLVALELDLDPQSRFRLVRSDFDLARFALNLDRASIRIGFDDLHAGGRASAKKIDHRFPVEGRAIGDEQDDATFMPVSLGRFVTATKFGGRLIESGSHCMIELSNASEPRVERDFRDRKFSLFDQASGEVDATGLRNSHRRGSEVLHE